MLRYVVLIISVLLSHSALALDETCLLQQLSQADNSKTVGEIRRACGKEEKKIEAPQYSESLITQRGLEERQTADSPFVITPHKPNYIIAGYNSSPNSSAFNQQFPDRDIEFDDYELKFQISLKFPLMQNLFKDNGDIYVAYTNRSFWQAFNKDISSPFRDSNHEPEAWIQFTNDWEIFGFKNRLISLGAVHQSNGQAADLSRSWNRLYASFVFERNDSYFYVKPWWRIPESEDVDDNPDITDYMGNFEFQGVQKYKDHRFGLMVRNNFDFSDNKGAVQLDWTFPLHDKLHGYVQWFNGYGESLIDYNHHVNTVGVGIKLTDWL